MNSKLSIFKIFYLNIYFDFYILSCDRAESINCEKYNISENGTLIKSDTIESKSERIKVVQISDTQIGSFYSTKNLKK